jgi:hypothetical protein
MDILKQKHWPEFKNFKIEKNGLRLETRQEDQFVNTLIDFDQIGNKEVIVNKKANPYGILAFASIFVNVMILIGYAATSISSSGILSGIGAGLTIGFSLWARQLFKFSKEKVLQGQQSISFFYGKKEKEHVDQFIQKLQSTKTSYIRDKYMKIDRYTPRDILKSRFIWLKENQYISETEIEILMQELENRKLIDGE